jgi:hypothetical protein
MKDKLNVIVQICKKTIYSIAISPGAQKCEIAEKSIATIDRAAFRGYNVKLKLKMHFKNEAYP